jgi:hypothetical protein
MKVNKNQAIQLVALLFLVESCATVSVEIVPSNDKFLSEYMFPPERFQYLYFYATEIINTERVESLRRLDTGEIEEKLYFHKIGTPDDNLLLSQVMIWRVANGVDQLVDEYFVTYSDPESRTGKVVSHDSKLEYSALSFNHIKVTSTEKYSSYSEKYETEVTRELRKETDNQDTVVLFIEGNTSIQSSDSAKGHTVHSYDKVFYKKGFGEYDHWHSYDKEFKILYDRKFLRRIDKLMLEPNQDEG